MVRLDKRVLLPEQHCSSSAARRVGIRLRLTRHNDNTAMPSDGDSSNLAKEVSHSLLVGVKQSGVCNHHWAAQGASNTT
jgi:hypothetical protein